MGYVENVSYVVAFRQTSILFGTLLGILVLKEPRYKPRLVGIAYECQRVDALPHEPWDMPLDAVLTERQLYRFDSNHP